MPSTLILLRHGESEWNHKNLFTGWYDSGLSPRGRKEAVRAGELMAEAGLRPAVVHTSLLLRAIDTADIALGALGMRWLPVRRSWRLNERHYGALQGKNKKETAERFGADAVKKWRRGYDSPPPPVDSHDPHHPRNDPRYAHASRPTCCRHASASRTSWPACFRGGTTCASPISSADRCSSPPTATASGRW